MWYILPARQINPTQHKTPWCDLQIVVKQKRHKLYNIQRIIVEMPCQPNTHIQDRNYTYTDKNDKIQSQ